MKIIPASDRTYAHVIISKQDRELIEEKVREQLTKTIGGIFSSTPKDEKK